MADTSRPQSSGPQRTSSPGFSKPTRIMNALVKLRMLTTSRSSAEPDVELQLTAYAERLAAWPIEAVERVLGDWPGRSQWWPSWLELQEQLPEPGACVLRLTSPGSEAETFAERATRLGLHRRLGAIGVKRWREVMDRHTTLADQQLLVALDRLEGGRPPFDPEPADAPFTRRADWIEFERSMRSLRDPNEPHFARAHLLAIGEKIEARQRPHAVAQGCA